MFAKGRKRRREEVGRTLRWHEFDTHKCWCYLYSIFTIAVFFLQASLLILFCSNWHVAESQAYESRNEAFRGSVY